MAKVEATVEEMVGMIERGELRLAKDHGVPIRQSYIRVTEALVVSNFQKHITQSTIPIRK